MFKDRIKELRRVPAGMLIANAKNWRKHPKAQSEAMKGILKEVGFAGAVLARETPEGLLLIDGHLRKETVNPAQEVPVLVLDVTEEEADKILATYDPLSAMASTDAEALNTLLEEIKTQDQSVARLMAELKEKSRELEIPEDEDGETMVQHEEGIFAYSESAVFSSSNEWGIPDLIPEMLSNQIPDRVWNARHTDDPTKTIYAHASGGMTKENCQGGVLCFYVEDYKFNHIWDEAVKFLAKLIYFEWGSVVEPDFSLVGDLPKIIRFQALYRMKWIARYWQEAGVKVIPTLKYGPRSDGDIYERVVPKNAEVVSVQVRTSKGHKPYMVDGLCRVIVAAQPQNVLLYGGDDNRKWLETELPNGPVYHWLSSYARVRNRRKNNG
jgi:hypothetical protein